MSTPGTKRLEAHARKLGRPVSIVKVPDNCGGLYFEVGDGDGPYSHWGGGWWTLAEARADLDHA
jgi:hypothetical protein